MNYTLVVDIPVHTGSKTRQERTSRMSYTITSDSPYVTERQPESEGVGQGQTINVDPARPPRVTLSGGNARLLNA